MPDPVQETAAAEPLTDEQLTEQFPGQDLGHLRSMMAKADGTPTPAAEPESDVVYPDYIPEKFRNGTVDDAVKAMATSYSSLEQTLSGKPTAAPAAEPTEGTPDPAAAEPAAADGVNLDTAADEFLANDGVITPESYAALAAKGMSKDMVDNYIAGQQAIAGQLITKVHAAAGGEEAYSKLMDWAGTNWTPAQIDAYDAVMASGTEESITLALSGLKAAATAASGPSLLTGDTGGDTAGAGTYQSKQEMTADMKNPLYKTDPAFRETVKRKLANSKVW